MTSPRRLTLLFVILLLLLSGFSAAYISAQSAGQQTAAFINVGQGDSTLLRDGQGFDVLIDGGKASAGDEVLAYLRASGVTQLDAIVATHADADHIGGLIEVLEASDIAVSSVYYNGYPGTTATWANFVAAVSAEGLALTPLQFPAELDWGEMRVYVLNPPAGLSNPETNDASVVLRVDVGQEINYLFTGDIDTEIEATIIARGTPVAAEILKVAHHGSAYGSSAAFLDAVSPDEAIISVGQNSYGHPDANTLARLQAVGAEIWRTDQNGDILVESDGLVCWILGQPGCAEAVETPPTTDTPVTPTPTKPGPIYRLLFLPLTVYGGESTPATPVPTATTPAPSATTPAPTATNPVPTATTPPPTTQPGQVEIVTIFYDGTKGSAEPDEYVEIRNSGGLAVQLSDWTLADASNHTFTFPTFSINPNQTCRVYTNEVHPETCGFSFGSSTAIWNNSGDTATLRDDQGSMIDTYSYP